MHGPKLNTVYYEIMGNMRCFYNPNIMFSAEARNFFHDLGGTGWRWAYEPEEGICWAPYRYQYQKSKLNLDNVQFIVNYMKDFIKKNIHQFPGLRFYGRFVLNSLGSVVTIVRSDSDGITIQHIYPQCKKCKNYDVKAFIALMIIAKRTNIKIPRDIRIMIYKQLGN